MTNSLIMKLLVRDLNRISIITANITISFLVAIYVGWILVLFSDWLIYCIFQGAGLIAGEGYVFTFKGGPAPIVLINVDVCNTFWFVEAYTHAIAAGILRNWMWTLCDWYLASLAELSTTYPLDQPRCTDTSRSYCTTPSPNRGLSTWYCAAA